MRRLFSKFHKLCNLAFEFGTYWQTGLAVVDVIPLFLGTAPDLQIDDGDLMISSGEKQGRTGQAVCVQHIPTGISVQSSGN